MRLVEDDFKNTILRLRQGAAPKFRDIIEKFQKYYIKIKT